MFNCFKFRGDRSGSVPFIPDLTTRWSVGAKYALRKGELRAGRGSGD